MIGESTCCNCKRKQTEDVDDDRYRLVFHSVSSRYVKKKLAYSFIRRLTSSTTARNYNLCAECREVCVNGSKEFKHVWPAFFWSILKMSYSTAFQGTVYYNQVYSGEHLWKIIPATMRPWWLDSIHSINHHGHYIFEHCTLTNPAPMFVDRTIEFSEYSAHIQSGEPCRLIRALDDERVNMPNVLCPFGCSCYCRTAKFADWDLVIQRYLVKTPLPLVSPDHYQGYHSMWQ